MLGHENREKLIRNHWARYGARAGWNPKTMPRLNIALRHKMTACGPYRRDEAPLPGTVSDYLTFNFERGTLDGLPAYRITCEGVVVEEGPLR